MADNNSNELDALMISELPTQATANETDLFEVAIVDANSASGYASKKESAAAIADAIVGEYQYPLRITGTTAKTIAGAINELKNLVDLLPQFAIEVVQTLPVSDISETTIYLVPAQDPEQGNYYEEYIYVNNAWELVGTTAVDLSGYYTSAQVDTLLAAKANTSSLATVATSGAYSDLSGKPTIDTALDTTSTNAVENRAVASEINSIKSDITVEGSASGDIATFGDGSANPLKELKISIVAQQSGTGDPSPDNVRPITGRTSATVTHTGKNLVNLENITNEEISSTKWCWEGKLIGNFVISVDKSRITNVANPDQAFLRIQVNGTIINIPYNSNGYAFSGELTLIGYYGSMAYARVSGVFSIQLEVGSTATPYEPYNGNIYNIDWQSTAGTVYGGTLNVKTGVLTVTHKHFQVSDYNWGLLSAENHIFYIYSDVTDKQAGIVNVISNMYKTENAFPSNLNDYSICGRNADSAIFVRDSRYSTVEDFKDNGNNTHIIYELATPVTYQLTPTEIRSLLGVNNVWADCGAITELKYTRDLNLCINDIIARIEALEGASSSRSLSVSSVLTKSLTSDSDTTESKAEETEEETKEEAQKNER